jgi:hypothetical protein
MTTIAKLDRSRAKEMPSSVFDAPHEIASEILLTRGEKLATLERWRRDVMREMSASTDGMRTNGVSDALIQQLAAIETTIETLEQNKPSSPSA